ncbi:alginate lyase family protein [Novipirellula herctigrandis]|uniref:heparinase II/III family protein n=1 Tax=Novipirellula herctigrandis TaxID=2527986 RepID=UPI003AF388B3
MNPLIIDSTECDRVLESAEQTLNGKATLLGIEWDFTGKVDWHRAANYQETWPQVFYADVFKSKNRPATDVKFVWEASRHQFLFELGKASRLTGNTAFSNRGRELILDWIAHNPPYIGVHWTSSLELAMRAISWMLFVGLSNEVDHWEPQDCDAICRSLSEHAEYLSHHLSFFSSPYNHLIGEATGLYLISLLLDGVVAKSNRWKDLALYVLRSHGPKQFYDDGFCVEQAISYHFFTLGFLSLATLAARNRGNDLSILASSVKNAFLAGMSFQTTDGTWPAIGDLDSARAIPSSVSATWDFGSLCNFAAVLFEEPKLKCGQIAGEEVTWFLGDAGIAKWRTLNRKGELPQSVLLRESGYAIASIKDHWLLFDAGPIAAGVHSDATPSVAHGHADTLQLLYWFKGRPLLQDSGIPSYYAPQDWVEYFRSSAAHNTIEVEGAGPVRSTGKLSWSFAAPAPQLDAYFATDFTMLCGSANWGNGVQVERHVLLTENFGLWIADYVKCDEPRKVSCYWQLASVNLDAATLESDGLHLPEASGRFYGNSPFSLRWIRATEREPFAKRALEYNSLVDAATLVVESSRSPEHLIAHHWHDREIDFDFSMGMGASLSSQSVVQSSTIHLQPQQVGWRLFADDAERVYIGVENSN